MPDDGVESLIWTRTMERVVWEDTYVSVSEHIVPISEESEEDLVKAIKRGRLEKGGPRSNRGKG